MAVKFRRRHGVAKSLRRIAVAEIDLALAAIRDPAVSARIVDSGCIPRPLAGKEFAAFIAGETQRLGEVVRAAGIVAS